MNASNLKQVLHVVITGIASKARVETSTLSSEFQNRQGKVKERIEAARKKVVDAAYAKVKAAPLNKSIEVTWADIYGGGGNGYSYSTFKAALTPWALDLLETARSTGTKELEELQAMVACDTIRFTYGTGINDYQQFSIPHARAEAYLALRTEYDALRVSLLLADDKSAGAAVTAFLARIASL